MIETNKLHNGSGSTVAGVGMSWFSKQAILRIFLESTSDTISIDPKGIYIGAGLKTAPVLKPYK